MARLRFMARACAPLMLSLGITACARPSGDAPRAPAACARWRASGSSLELVVLGSGGPRASGRAASSYLVVVDGAPRILVDVGPGASTRLGELDADLAAIDTVLLTHLHVDHAGDLPGFIKSRDLDHPPLP